MLGQSDFGDGPINSDLHFYFFASIAEPIVLKCPSDIGIVLYSSLCYVGL